VKPFVFLLVMGSVESRQAPASRNGPNSHLLLEGFDEEELNKVMPNQLDKQITGLLNKLQAPWLCDKSDGGIEGFLYKRQRKAPHNWKLYKFVLSGNNLYYYKNEKTKKPRGIISVSFISSKLKTSESQLLEIKNPEVSHQHFMVFSPNRLDMLCAQNDQDLEQWHTALDKVVRDHLTPEEVATREKYIQELLPLMAQKTSHDMERILIMIAELESSGFTPSRSRKEKTGNLFMMEEDDANNVSWIKYYFVLQDQCLYYYKTSKAPPKGIITLKFTQIQPETSPELQYCFRLTTPLSQFVLKAKHQVAMEDWVKALEDSKAGKKKDHKGEGEKDSLIAGDEFTDLNRMVELEITDGVSYGYTKKVQPQLTFTTPEGKTKTIKLNLGRTTIGRSDSCSIKVDDKKVSRSHAKIEINEHAAFVLDLGSGHGTKVNHHRIDKQLIKPGDTIKVGKTRLKFEAPKK
jgi:hypothetical protein